MTKAHPGILAFAHIGDLHITDAQQPNFQDLLAIVAQIETQTGGQLDFVVLPGDCADNGLPGQYALIAAALRVLSIPVHIIPGDHDMQQGNLANFYKGLATPPLPHTVRLEGYRCLFVDFCGSGSGGPDFRLGHEQLSWLSSELSGANRAGETPVVFMHGYPADLRDRKEAESLTRILADHKVAFVDMGHTHYNELSNDGTTVFAATRSTGQIDEGPVGYSITTLHNGAVSWRFKLLDDPFPFVMITAPADYRLQRDGAGSPLERSVGVRVFGAEPIDRVEYQLEDGPWHSMQRAPSGIDWFAPLQSVAGRLTRLAARAFSQSGRPGMHAISIAGPDYRSPNRVADGSDAATIGAWPENGIPGTQLGPNRYGRKW